MSGEVIRYRPNSETLHEALFPWLTRCGLVTNEESKTEEGVPNCSKCNLASPIDFSLYFENGFGATVACYNRQLIDDVRKKSDQYEALYWPYGYKIEIFYPMRTFDNVTILARFDTDENMFSFVELTVSLLAVDLDNRLKAYGEYKKEYVERLKLAASKTLTKESRP
jgi:hypothetical protein